MSLHVCADCETAYLPADVCPHCGGGVFRFDWEEDDMPKITVEGGATAYHDDNPAPADGDVKPKPAARKATAKAEEPAEADTTE